MKFGKPVSPIHNLEGSDNERFQGLPLMIPYAAQIDQRPTCGVACILAAVIAGAAFANAFWGEYVYDDVEIVQQNPAVTQAGQFARIWTTDYWGHTRSFSEDRDLLYRPLSLSSFRLIHAAFGANAFWQRLTNVLLHALSSALVVLLARRIGLTAMPALVAGVLFAVLPIHTEAVNEIVGRCDLLATIGVIFALIAQGRLAETTSWKATGWACVAGAAAFVAMTAKESGIAAVPLVVLWAWLAPSTVASCSARTKARISLSDYGPQEPKDMEGGKASVHWRRAAGVIAVLVAAGAYLILRHEALGGQLYQRPAISRTVNVLAEAPGWQRGLGVMQLWGMYWAKTIHPKVLCISYTIPQIAAARSVLNPHVLLGILVALMLLAYGVRAWLGGRRLPMLLFASIVIAHLPTANALALIQVFFAERLWYLPSVFVILLAAEAADRWPWKRLGLVLVIAVAFPMIVRCWIRNSEWRDNGRLYAACVRDHSQAIGCLFPYGLWLVEHGEVRRGIDFLERARSIDLGFTDASWALADAYAQLGDLPAAMRHLQAARMQRPSYPATRRLEAALEGRLAELAEVKVSGLREAAATDPENLEAHLSLAAALRDLGRTEEAVRLFEEGEGRFGGNARWRHEYAVALMVMGATIKAEEQYRESLRLDGSNGQAKVELAMLLLQKDPQGGMAEAERLCEEVIKSQPELSGGYVCRGEVLVLRGDIAGAVSAYQTAIRRLGPEDPMVDVYRNRIQSLGG